MKKLFTLLALVCFALAQGPRAFATGDFYTGYYGGIIGMGGSPGSQGRISITTRVSGLYTLQVNVAGVSFSHKGYIQGDSTVSDDFSIPLFGGLVKIPVHLEFTRSLDQETITGTATIKGESLNFELHNAGSFTLSSPAPPAGRHTAYFSPDQNNPDVPGPGVATITVSTYGAVRVVGYLGDGAKINCGGSLSKDLVFPIVNVLYGRKGAIAGFAQFGTPNAGSTNNTLNWARIVSRQNPVFVFNGKLMIAIHPYTPPAAGTPAVALDAGTNTEPLGLAGGGIANYTPANITLSNTNTLTVSGDNAARIKLSLNATTGLIKGSAVIETSGMLRRRPIKLVVLQDSGFIEGFFIGTESTGTAVISQP